jgi:hypothetical protein
VGTNKCLQRPVGQAGQAGTGEPSLGTCVIETFAPQSFVVSERGFIMSDDSVCLDSPDAALTYPQVRLLICGGVDRQRWAYDKEVSSFSLVFLPLFIQLRSRAWAMDMKIFQSRGLWSSLHSLGRTRAISQVTLN